MRHLRLRRHAAVAAVGSVAVGAFALGSGCGTSLPDDCASYGNCPTDDASTVDGQADGNSADGSNDASTDSPSADGARDGSGDALADGASCDSATAIVCSGQCVDPGSAAHCGSCSNVCAPPASGHGQATCTLPSTCGVSCGTGYHLCNGDCLSDADDPSMDACVVSEALGVFVAPTGSDVSTCGTKASPCQTVGYGIGVAHAANKRTYVCEGSYNEHLVVNAALDGAKVYGGFACGTWTYDAAKKPKIAPTTTGYALVIDSLATGVLFEDFAFETTSAVTPGDSSIAVFAKSSTGVVFRRSSITAGAGVQGQDPAQPAPFTTVAPTGGTGTLLAGTAVTPNPSCTTSVGGGGGTPTMGGQDGTDGTPGASNKGLASAQDCGNGSSGRNGTNGGSGGGGSGASSWATFTASSWSPTSGTGGAAGAVGQGGGGGASVDPTGGGGGGGAGGCGGSGGSGGTGGGSSIAVLAYSSSVDLETSTLTSANAGRGGNGAAGQTGQTKGIKGNGFNTGCQGGNGGNGGNGGVGGGGAGGLSAGVVWFGTAPTVNGTSTPSAATLSGVTFGSLGAGGTGGNTGKAGVSAAVVQFQ